jgi:hypothetical protein
VRGTVFAVDVEDLDGTTLVSVDEGLVAVRNKVAGGEVYVHPTEQVRVWRNQPLAQKLIDNGSIARKVLDAVRDAARVALERQTGGGGVGAPGTTTTGPQGDKCGKSCPTTTAPAPPSAPPPPPPPAP